MRKTNELPFYEMIEKAVSGDKIAIIDLLKYYDAYISKVCLRPLYCIFHLSSASFPEIQST